MDGDWQLVTDDSPPTNMPVLIYGSKRLSWAVAARNEHGEWLLETCSDMVNIYPPRWWHPLPCEPERLSR